MTPRALPATTAALVVTDTPVTERAPAWSPDGRLMAFEVVTRDNHRTNYDIYVMEADGSNRRQLTSTPLAAERWPSWRPPQGSP